MNAITELKKEIKATRRRLIEFERALLLLQGQRPKRKRRKSKPNTESAAPEPKRRGRPRKEPVSVAKTIKTVPAAEPKTE